MEYFIGLDLGGTDLKGGMIDREGNIIYKTKFPTRAELPPNEIVENMIHNIQDLISNSGISKTAIKGIGFGAPGLIDPVHGLLKTVCNIPSLDGVYLSPQIEKALNIPTFLDNDVNGMILGEYYYGAAKGYEHVIALTLGTGVGGGIILNGSIFRGASYTAGEIGHMSIDPSGILCPCGNYGCLERYVGRDAVVNRIKSYYEKKKFASSINRYLEDGEITPKSVYEAAVDGDECARSVLEETGRFLGIGLANLVNIFNPQLIVIGGGLANAGEFIFQAAELEMKKRAYWVPAEEVKIVPAALKNNAGIVGTASIAIDFLYNQNQE